MEYIQEAAPIKVSGMVVASYGSEWRRGWPGWKGGWGGLKKGGCAVLEPNVAGSRFALTPSHPPPAAADDPNLGCPVEYISLKGTSADKPAVCKYTGNKFYSDDWKGGGHH
jgi:hypothetical protein